METRWREPPGAEEDARAERKRARRRTAEACASTSLAGSSDPLAFLWRPRGSSSCIMCRDVLYCACAGFRRCRIRACRQRLLGGQHVRKFGGAATARGAGGWELSLSSPRPGRLFAFGIRVLRRTARANLHRQQRRNDQWGRRRGTGRHRELQVSVWRFSVRTDVPYHRRPGCRVQFDSRSGSRPRLSGHSGSYAEQRPFLLLSLRELSWDSARRSTSHPRQARGREKLATRVATARSLRGGIAQESGVDWPQRARFKSVVTTSDYSVLLEGVDALDLSLGVFRDLCDLLLEGAQRSARLVAEGRSVARGAVPAWVSAAADITALRLNDGRVLRGYAGSVSLDTLKELLGTDVVLEGGITFRPSGEALRIEVESVFPATPGDVIWAQFPKVEPNASRSRSWTALTGLDAFFGTWPGDETDEQLAAAPGS
jgi:hypothetical protein